jgi:predicted sulfurtransferase
MTLVFAALWFTNRAVTPKQSTMADVEAEARSGSYRLINTAELKDLYETKRDKVLLVDTRQDWEYAAGHIAGAVNFPMEPTAWSRFWKKSDLDALLGGDKDKLIVFY